MKTSSFVAAILLLTVSLCGSLSYAQSADKAADKNKQANLEKLKAHQAEMQKKYNAMTPEQAADARKRAHDYKNGGYKNKTGRAASASTVKTPTVSSARPSATVKPAQGKPTGTHPRVGASAKPILMDANGKPLRTTSPAATRAIKAEPKAPASKTVMPILKTPASGADKK